MKFVSSALDNYRFTLVVITTVIILGVVSFFTMPRTEDPQLSFPINYIVALHPGTAPLDMEQMVVDPLEEAINEIDALKEIRTDIKDGLATFRVEFDYGTDPNEKYNELLAAVNAAKSRLPSDIAKLDVKKLSPTDVNIVQIALVSETASYRQLRLYAERFEKRLERISGIRRADVWGLPDQQVQITLDFDKIQHYGISLTDSYQVLVGEARNLSGGHVNTGARRLTVRTSGRYEDLQAIRNTLIRSKDGQPIYLKDVATIEFVDAEPRYIARFNGKRAVFVTAMQNEGISVFTVMPRIKKSLERLKQTLPDDVVAEIALDQSNSVATRLGGFFDNLIWGLSMVGLIVLLFMGLKNMFIIVITIPISVFIGFGLLDQSGFGIEQMSIVGLIVALGLLVDNAIVVTENITSKKDKGMKRQEAAKTGVMEVSWAVTSGTITTVLAFLPILWMQTNAGDFIRSLPVTVVFTLVASLFIALLFTPLFASLIYKFESKKRISKPVLGSVLLRRFAQGPYQLVLKCCMKYSKSFIFVSLLGFFASLSLFSSIGFSFMPKAENNRLLVNIKLPENASLRQTEQVLDRVEHELKDIDFIEHYASNIGHGNPRIYYSETPTAEMPNRAQIFVQIEAANSHEFWDATQVLTERFRNFPLAEVTIKEFQQGTPIEAPIVVRLFGDDFEVLNEVSQTIERLVERTPHTTNVQNPLGDRKLDLKVSIDYERAAQLNLPVANIDAAVRMSLVGNYIGQYRDKYGDDFPIVIKLSKPSGATIPDISKIKVENVYGQLVPLMQVAKLELVTVAAHIQHYNTQRSSKITADVEKGHNVQSVTQQVHEQLKLLTLPDGVHYEIGGEQKSQGEAFRGFIKSIIIALFGIFTVLVFQFRSFSQPVIVFISIPFAISGAVLALYVTGYEFSFMAFLGVAGLIGIVVNNAIILIDSANGYHGGGHSKYQACLQASIGRLPPVILTTMTTIVSLFPVAMQGSLTWSPLAWVTIGGLAVSTLISLLLVPVLYSFFADKSVPISHSLKDA
ncbi:efflux RND transporter permease subunit [Pseudoalteromonas sp. DL2-H2.2]|uniref:efflux RND transporter permease subunit n=1 Tax=Pseudoalteromonas sp. DL2-H2.2 TaxID=2908889 RepID=UPI001F2864F9|nr:efflux RND transporter permease subunit [Pseudoalteromonas sp. DL2-H2.2]MCF2909106.1 efflux RND transporter permease subunit [Pseudoalteromonas sp. DL2-H2.2]